MRSRTENFLPGFKELGVRRFGGALLKGNPRSARPLSTKRPLHLVMRSSMAVGKRSLLQPDRAGRVEKMVHRLGKHQGVKILRFANGGNHLHLLVRPRSRKAFHSFVRALSGVAARLSLERERGKAATKKSKNSYRSPEDFWDARPFTRIIDWGHGYNIIARTLENGTRGKGLRDLHDFWPRTLKESTA